MPQAVKLVHIGKVMNKRENQTIAISFLRQNIFRRSTAANRHIFNKRIKKEQVHSGTQFSEFSHTLFTKTSANNM